MQHCVCYDLRLKVRLTATLPESDEKTSLTLYLRSAFSETADLLRTAWSLNQ